MFDVLLANHVLDGLPKGDFDRLLHLVSRSLKPEGIVYARGSLQYKSFTEMPNYHGYDVFEKFRELGFETESNDYYPSQCYNVVVWRRSERRR